MPGLDVVRGLAILLVLYNHGVHPFHTEFSGINPLLSFFWQMSWYGWLGVHLFFVLSGFLITGILLDSREKDDYYKRFYLRRAVRILPAYLVVLVFLKSTHWIDWRYLAVALLYMTNVCSAFHTVPQYGPLWSLSVEEQFYITWPLAVKNLSRRGLLWLSVAIVALSPLLRLGLLYGPRIANDYLHKTWAVGDFFASGAILSIAVRSPRMRPWLDKIAYPLLIAGVVTLAVSMAIPNAPSTLLSRVEYATNQEPMLILWTAVVLLAFLNPQIANFRLLRPLVFISDISYGIYLYHMIVYVYVDRYWPIDTQNPLTTLVMWGARLAVETALSIAVAWISRRTLEEFFLRLKLNMRRPKAPASA
jgi:peptidoglycan/LPS O-acetylase OafA/YrhL